MPGKIKISLKEIYKRAFFDGKEAVVLLLEQLRYAGLLEWQPVSDRRSDNAYIVIEAPPETEEETCLPSHRQVWLRQNLSRIRSFGLEVEKS